MFPQAPVCSALRRTFNAQVRGNACLLHGGDFLIALRLRLLGHLGRHWWRLSLDVVRVVQVTRPHLPDEVLGLRVGEVVALIDFLWVGLALFVALSLWHHV